jgi:hypothetical membrane protein
MTVKSLLMHKKIGMLAVIGPIYALGSIAISIMLSPWFTWRNNAISDLGVHPVAPIFNISLIACGIMCAVFALGAIVRLRSLTARTGFALMLLASISLVGIGIFTEDYSPHHFIFSVAFFVMLLLATLELGPWFLLKRKTHYLGIASLSVTAVGVFGWAYHSAVGWGQGVAIPEVLTFVPGAIWFAMLGFWVLKKDNKN